MGSGKRGGWGALTICTRTHTLTKVHTVQLASPLCLYGRHSVAVPFENNMQVTGMYALKIAGQLMTSEYPNHTRLPAL